MCFSLCLAVAETAEVIVLKALILQVICLYQKVVPHLVNQSKFDFSKLFKGDFVVFPFGVNVSFVLSTPAAVLAAPRI